MTKMMKLGSPGSLRVLLVVLFLIHAIQIWGPLRLNTDAEHFLSYATLAADSAQSFPLASSPPHPPGYATMIAVLDRAGLGSTPVLVLVNLAFIAVGVVAAYGVAARGFGFNEHGALIVCVMTLLSFVVVKHAPIPLSDVPFFGVAMAALYALVQAETGPRSRWLWLGLALLLCVGAIVLRTIGVALLPALVWGACGKRKQLAAALLVVGVVLGPLILSSSDYGRYALEKFQTGEAWRVIASARLNELGELALNIPSSRLPDSLAPLFWIAAGALFCASAAGVACWKSGGVAELFLITFAGILLVWPYEDARFWLPVVPVMIAAAWMGLNKIPRLFVFSWAGVYTALGVAALVFSVGLSFSGSKLGDSFGNGVKRHAYRAAWGGPPATAESDLKTLAILQRFDPRARPPAR